MPRGVFLNGKNNENVPFNIQKYVKDNLNLMAIEQGLYAQVVMLR